MTQAERIQLFLSYATQDDTFTDGTNYPDDPTRSLMRRLYTDLTAHGFAVWWDHVSMPSRSLPMSTEIEAALRACTRFVLVIGEHLRDSVWVREEIAFAERECKPITMILRSGTLEHIPDGMSDTRAIDFRLPREYAPTFEALVARLHEEAPFGETFGVRQLPDFLLERPIPFNAARDSICSTAINPTVISAPTRSNTPRPTAVSGYGGIGKSTLAVMLAQDCEVRRFFKDGVIWLDVGQKPIITELQARVGVSVFGDNRDNYQNAEDGRKALSWVLRDKAALIVLDDVWDRYIIDQFPTTGTPCRLLITTRSRTLAGQIDGADILLDLLTDKEGAALIARRAGGSADDPIYQQIAHLLGGHTLAIRLASEQLANHYADSTADLLQLLTKRENLFAHLKLSEDNKDENVERSLSLSYSALQSDLKERFRALGALAANSTFNRAMLAALWEEANEDAVRLPLSTLVNAGLISYEGEGYYRQHGLLRAYADALLIQIGELEPTFARYADFVIEQVKQFYQLPMEQWSQLDPLLAHVSEVGEALTDQWGAYQANPDEALVKHGGDFAYNVRKYVENRPQMIDTPRGRERLGLRWLEMGLAISRHTGDQRSESLFCNEIGFAWDSLGAKRKALDYFEQGLVLDRALGDRGGEAAVLHNIGAVWRTLGEKRKALEYYEQALPLQRGVGDRRGESRTLSNIGAVWSDLGEKRKALEYYEQALLLSRALGNRGYEATTLNNIGKVWGDLGEPHQALDYYEQALTLSRAVGDRSGEAVTLSNIGAVWHTLGEPRKALEFFEQALPLRRAVGDRGGEAATLTSIGAVWDDLGEPRKALEFFEQALPLCRAVGDRSVEATTLNNMGFIYFQAGDLARTVAIQQQIIQIVRDMGAVAQEALYLFNIAAVYEKMGKIDEAIQSAETGKAILVRYNLPQDAGGARIEVYDQALAYLRGKQG